MAREAAFFKDTRFFSDRFHMINHKSCACVFDLSLLGLAVNSSRVESENAIINLVKHHCGRMSQESFMWFFTFFFSFRNLRVNGVKSLCMLPFDK